MLHILGMIIETARQYSLSVLVIKLFRNNNMITSDWKKVYKWKTLSDLLNLNSFYSYKCTAFTFSVVAILFTMRHN